jgi:hypothetical protein
VRARVWVRACARVRGSYLDHHHHHQRRRLREAATPRPFYPALTLLLFVKSMGPTRRHCCHSNRTSSSVTTAATALCAHGLVLEGQNFSRDVECSLVLYQSCLAGIRNTYHSATFCAQNLPDDGDDNDKPHKHSGGPAGRMGTDNKRKMAVSQ